MTTRILIGLAVVALLVGGGFLAFHYLRPPPEPDEDALRPPERDDGSVSAPLSGMLKAGDNWPGFRGPTGQGTSADTKLPLEWGDKKNLRWKAKLPGPGSSSPVVWGERVFVTCFSGHEKDKEGLSQLRRHLVCVNRADGKVLWTKAVPAEKKEDAYAGYRNEHGYASNTPATDGERVYCFFGRSGVFAFDLGGEQLWHAEVGKGPFPESWGSAASLVLYGDLVIVNASSESEALFAFSRQTGEQKWKATPGPPASTYNTPVLVPRGDEVDLVLAVANPEKGQVWGINPVTGRTRWHADIDIADNVTPSVVAEGGVVYITGGHPARKIIAVDVKAALGEAKGPAVLWSNDSGPYVPSPAVSGGRLFVVTEKGTAFCWDARTGDKLGFARLPTGRGAKAPYASPVLAGGRLYCVMRRGGTVVLEAGPKLKRLATNPLDDDSDFNASPAVSRGQIFLRSDRFLYCVGQ